MATKSNSKSMAFIAIAIIIVLAAIGFVAYDEWSSHSGLFGNEKFARAVAEALNVTPASLSEESLSDVKVLEVYYDETTKEFSVTAAREFDTKAFLDLNKQYEEIATKYEELSADEENDHTSELTTLSVEANSVMTQINALSENIELVAVSADEIPALDDVKYFANLEMLSLIGVSVADSSVFEGMNNLMNLTVQNCGLTEVNGLAGLDAENVYAVVISESGVTDWTPLNYIAEKVSIPNYIDFGNGQVFQYGTTTLADYNASLEAAEKEEVAEETVEGEEASEETAEEAVEGEEVAKETVEAEETEETPAE